MKQLDINAVQHRLLNIAIVVDELCAKHGIPFYMIAGTMLGAIRHKGFIPWDDDMDFAVPYEDYQTLMQVLKEELPREYRCLTYDESDTYRIPWIKVEDLSTMVYDYSLNVSESKMPGLTIDIFPLVCCQKGECDVYVHKIQWWISFSRNVYIFSRGSHHRIKNFVKKMIAAILPLSQKEIIDKIMGLTDRIPKGMYYSIPMDPNYSNRYFPCQWFKPLTEFPFENTRFYGVTQYDKYLKELYGNYMELPPLEKRRDHCDNVFYK